MVKKALFLSITAVMLLGLLGTASAQDQSLASTYFPYPNAIGNPVPGNTPPGNANQYWPGRFQGVFPPDSIPYYPSDPAAGVYDILINGYIEAYARVDVYDNWINFDWMDPTTGTYDNPYRRYAFTNAANGNGVARLGTAAEIAHGTNGAGATQPVVYPVDGSGIEFDLAGFRVQTNARLDLNIDMGSWLTRVNEQGDTWSGIDTRREDGGPYQLRNQAKLKFKGRFLLADAFAGTPAEEDSGTQFDSPTACLPGGVAGPHSTTDYNTWTWWGSGINVIDGEDGWFDPTTTQRDPWWGWYSGAFVPDGGTGGLDRDKFQIVDLVVERGQAQGTGGGLSSPVAGTAEAAEVWTTQRVIRRGLQDVQGNYRADMMVRLYYRESDAQWVPPSTSWDVDWYTGP